MVWNQRYVDMYGIDQKRIWLGCTIRDLLDARIAAGTFPLDPARYDAELRAALKQGRSFTLNIELADGRIIAVVNQPSPAAAGWRRTRTSPSASAPNASSNIPAPSSTPSSRACRRRSSSRAFPACATSTSTAPPRRAWASSATTILGKTSPEIMPVATARAIAAEDRKVIDNGDTTFVEEHAMLTPGNGTRIVAATRHIVRGPDGKPQYQIALVRDLTDRKRDEQRIAHMAHHDR